MLDRIRKGANSSFVKFILAVIALSFLGFGGSSLLSSSDKDIVTFNNAKSISMQEFFAARGRKLDLVQKQNNVNFNDNQIAELRINEEVIKELINKSIIANIADNYDFDISDAKVIEYVKKEPAFHNTEGEFDHNIFKALFQNNPRLEQEYLLFVKSQLLDNVITSVFQKNYPTPAFLSDAVVKYMAETLTFDIYKINLLQEPYKASKESKKMPSIEEIEKFYEDNKNLFRTEEMRDISYFMIDEEFIKSKVHLKAHEIEDFYNENRDEFEGKSFIQAKNEVKEMLNAN